MGLFLKWHGTLEVEVMAGMYKIVVRLEVHRLDSLPIRLLEFPSLSRCFGRLVVDFLC